MAATAKQLAALKKARAARAKNLGKKVTKKKAVKKTVKRRSNPVKRKTTTHKPTPHHVIKVVTTSGQVGYVKDVSVKGVTFDDDIKNAFTGAHRAMNAILSAVYMIRPRGIKSIELVKK